MNRIKNRNKDQVIQDVVNFLNDLFMCFNHNEWVLFTRMNIEKTAKKYHINGRLHRIVVSREFILNNRKYARRFQSAPTVESICEYIKDAQYKRSLESKKYYDNLDVVYKKRLHKKKYRRRKNSLTPNEKHELAVKAYKKRLETFKDVNLKTQYYKDQYAKAVTRKIKYETLYAEIQAAIPKLQSYCKKITPDYEDLVQDTCLTALTVKNRYSIGTNISAWLIGIAINLRSINEKKSNGKNEILVSDFDEDIVPSDIQEEYTVNDKYMADLNQDGLVNTVRAQIKECFNELPDKLKPYIILDAKGLNHERIAETLKITETYSRIRLYQARNNLIAKIEKKFNVKLSKKQAWDLTHNNLIPID